MKLTLQIHNKTHTTECGDDVTLTDMCDTFRGMLVQAGFHPSSVEAMFDVTALDSWDIGPNDSDVIDMHSLTNQIN